MVNKDLYNQWKQDEQAIFQGWDFSYLNGRNEEEKPPWDYMSMAKGLVKNSNSLLDVDTGGGERFSELAPFPKNTFATEGYQPNLEIARKRLEPLGVQVVEADSSGHLPFTDGEFDLILNKHGGFNISELHRVLKPQGQFFTQQVGGDNLTDLMDFFHIKSKWPDMKLNIVKPKFEEHGFIIKQSAEFSGKEVFHDVGALVYFLKAIPWIVDGFSVDSHLSYLEQLQEQLERKGKLEFTCTRYLIWAIKR